MIAEARPWHRCAVICPKPSVGMALTVIPKMLIFWRLKSSTNCSRHSPKPRCRRRQVALNFALTEGQGCAIVGARNKQQVLEMLGVEAVEGGWAGFQVPKDGVFNRSSTQLACLKCSMRGPKRLPSTRR